MIIIEISTEAISLYGAIIGSLSAITALGAFWISYRNYSKLRPIIKVNILNGIKTLPEFGKGGTFTITTLVNRGHKPVVIVKLWYIPKDGAGKILFPDSMKDGGKTINYGENHDYVISEADFDINKMKKVCFEDATGIIRKKSVKRALKKYV